MDYAILGGGALGLMAAYRLTQAGHAVMVFEQEKTAGGLGTLSMSRSSEAGLQWCFEPVPEDGPGRLQAPLAVASSTRRRILSGWRPPFGGESIR